MQNRHYDIGIAFSDSFDLLKKQPLRLIGWGALLVILPNILLIPMWQWIIANWEVVRTDPEAANRVTGLTMLGNLSSVLQMLILIPIIAAVIRLILKKPPKRGVAGLSLGMDELWVFVCNVAVFVGVFALMFPALLVFAIGAFLADQSNIAGALTVLLGLGFGVVTFGVTIWLAIRLSLVVPASIDLNNFAFVEAWKASRGHFWPLLGTAILVFLGAIAVSILWFLLAALVAMVLIFVGTVTGMVSFGEQVRWADWGPLVIGGGLVMLVPTLWLSVATYVIYVGPFASAWRQLKPRPVVAAETPFERM